MSVMGYRVGFLVLFIVFLISCAGTTNRVPIHQIVGVNTIYTKVVLLEKDQIDPAYQRAVAREYEMVLMTKPAGFVIRSKFSGKPVDVVLIRRKDVHTISDTTPETIVGIGEESDVHLVVVVKPTKLEFREGSANRGEEFCVTRTAEVVVSVKMMETKKGEVVHASAYDGKAEDRQCSKGMRRTDKLASKDALIGKAIKRSASKFAEDFWENL